MLFLRKLLFYGFTLIYIIVCPLVILYAFGYILKPGMEMGIIKTGLIYLSTAPPGADVYMNEKEVTQKTPATLRGLLPGQYSIKLELNGYQDWKDSVPVESEKATVIDSILFLPEERQVTQLLAGAFKDIIPVRGSGFFLLSADKAQDLTAYGYNTGKSCRIFEDAKDVRDCRILAYFTVPESAAVILRVGFPEGEKMLWVKPDAEKPVIKDVTSLFQFAPEKIKWLPGKETDLFVFLDGSLSRIDVEKLAVYPEYIRDVRGYGLYGGEIYVLKNDNVLLKMSLDAKSSKVLLDDADLAKTIFGEKGFFDIEVFSDNIILFSGEKGELLSNRLPYHFVEEGVRGMEYYAAQECLLVWTKNKVGVLDFSMEETTGTEFEKPPKLVWIYENGKDIQQAFWVYEASHILFRDKGKQYLVAIEEYGTFLLKELEGINNGHSIDYAEETGELYFTDSKTGELFSTGIVPVKSLVPAPISGITDKTMKNMDEWEKETEKKRKR